jgi:dynein heavy chain
MKTLKDMKVDKRANAYVGILDEIKKWLVFLPLIEDLAIPAMQPRHWDDLKKRINAEFTIDDKLTLKDIYDLNLGKFADDVEEICDQARQEDKMEKYLAKVKLAWKDICFDFTPHKGTGAQMIRLAEESFDLLEENQVGVTAMFSSRYLSTFEDDVVYWQKALAAVSEIVILLGEVQRTWSFLENLFIHSDEVKKELPKESIKFVEIDKSVKQILDDGYKKQKCIDFSV